MNWRPGFLLASAVSLYPALYPALCPALTPREVLVVGNARSPVSKSVAEYYARRRAIPAEQILYLRTAPVEEIERRVYDKEIAAPVAEFLARRGWVDRILAIVTTSGVPLKIQGTGGGQATAASVDVNWLVCTARANRMRCPAAGEPLPADRRSAIRFPMYPVTRPPRRSPTSGDDRPFVAQTRAGGDRQERRGADEDGEFWLHRTAAQLPDRVVLEETAAVPRRARI